MKEYRNGYGMREEEYSSLLDKLYGFEEYYYYKQDNHYKDYLFVINELDKIKYNAPMEESYRNAIIGWYIFFKNSKRVLPSTQLCFRVTDACQLKCKHCYQQQAPKVNKHMTYDEFVYLFYKHQDIIKKFVHYEDIPIKFIDFEGGETTLNPDICKIIQFLNNKGIGISLATNGINVPDELINVIKNNKHNRVQVSIDGLEQTHNFIRGEGTFKKSIASLKKILANNIDSPANMVIHEANYHEFNELKKYLKNEVGCRLGHMLYSPQCNSPLKFLCKEDLEDYIKTHNLPYEGGNCNSSFKCSIGHQSIIREDGGFLSCGRGYDYSIANYFTDDDNTILEKIKKFILRWRSVPVYCFDCKNVSSCLGGMLCQNAIKDNYYSFNQEDKICQILHKKEVGDMYEIQTIL